MQLEIWKIELGEVWDLTIEYLGLKSAEDLILGSCCRNVEKKVTDGRNYIFPWVVDFEAVLASVLVYLFFFPKSISSN